jgi:hypothetical protein
VKFLIRSVSPRVDELVDQRVDDRAHDLGLNLVVLPATAALAAGNRVMIKMSEVTPRNRRLKAYEGGRV